MDYLQYFAADYQQARRKFLEAADNAGARLEHHRHPLKGPDGGALYMDVALIGNPDADRVMLCACGIHGAEGFCGSGAFVGWLRSGDYRALEDNVRVVLVHPLNPHGFAWLRRVNEDNIDLNRNFLDFSQPLPENPGYEDLHHLMLPDDWAAGGHQQIVDGLAAYGEAHGEAALRAAIARGQYAHADGPFFGGSEAAWSNLTYRRIIADHVKGAAYVAEQDFHTGLGPYGTVDMISSYVPDTADGDNLYRVYGEGLSNPLLGNSTSQPLTGVDHLAVQEILAASQVTSVTMEFGTYPFEQVSEALLADNWLHARGKLGSDLGRRIKAQIRRAFYPDEDEWKELVFIRSRQVLRRVARALAAYP